MRNESDSENNAKPTPLTPLTPLIPQLTGEIIMCQKLLTNLVIFLFVTISPSITPVFAADWSDYKIKYHAGATTARNKTDWPAYITKLIDSEEKQAQNSCERIKNDLFWKEIASTFNKRIDLYNSLPDDEKGLNEFGVGYDWYPDHFREIANAYDELKKQHNDKKSNIEQEMVGTRLIRTFRLCGDELIAKGLLPLKSPGKEQSERYKEKLTRSIEALQEYEMNAHKIATRAMTSGNSETEIKSRIEGEFYNSRLDGGIIEILQVIEFPKYDLFEGGDNYFASTFDLNHLKANHEKRMAFITQLLNERRKGKANKLQAEQNEQIANKERQARIVKIKQGNISVAKSCVEVAVGLIGEKELGGNYEMALSKDFQDVYVKPTNKLYAGIGKIIDSDKSTITVLQSDAFSNKQFVFQLRHGNKTLWFGDKVAHGAYITFVGRYIDNATTLMRQGNNTLQMPSRVYDVVCVSS